MKYYIDPKNSLLTKKTAKAFKNHSLKKSLDEICPEIKSLKNLNSFQKLVNRIVATAKSEKIPPTKINIHPKEISEIKKMKPLTEKTIWGGVSLKKVDVGENYIRKLLVINKFGILGFEFHKQKIENLKILEGYCLVIYSCHKAKTWEKGKIEIKLATVGDKFHFEPYDEHGIIALSDCTVEETSTNNLDDLFYIFKLSQSN